MAYAEYPARARRASHAGLALVAGLHVLLALCWLRPTRHPHDDAARKGMELMFVLQPKPPALATPVAPPPVAPRSVRLARAPAPRLPITAMTLTQSAAQRPTQPAPAAEPPPTASDAVAPTISVDDLRQIVRRDINQIDRDLRKRSLNVASRVIANDQTELARNIDAAFKGGGLASQVEEVVLGDGTHMSKIHTPLGTYCAAMGSNAPGGGRDPFKDGVKTKFFTCPH